MAFGFFKKAETADTIFYNGRIFTQDPELPWADAVAVKEERILGVGNFSEMDAITGKDTALIDLEQKFMFPGFIDAHRSPVLKAFEDQYLDLSDLSSCEEILSAVSVWAEDHEDAETIFGYGYRDDLKPDGENAARILSEVCADKPVLLLCKNGVQCWINEKAAEIVMRTAEEEVVETITVSYILNLLIPFDFEEIEDTVRYEMETLAARGVTTVLDIGAPDYFETLYEDSILGLYNEGEMRQRFFGSYLVNRPLQPRMIVHKLMQRRTNCLEIGDMINAEMLYLYLDASGCPISFTPEMAAAITEEAADKGFSIFIEAIGEEDLKAAYLALETLRSKGYKNTVILASDAACDADFMKDLLHADTAILACGTNPLSGSVIPPETDSVSDAVESLTAEAAAILGAADKLGKIKVGYLADFTVFEQNPLDGTLQTFAKQRAAMTVVGGTVVYDEQAEADMDLYRIMSSQHL